jgi:Flp pilus assembly protein TadD
LRDSQEAARDGDVTGAAASASVATRLLPYAASPALQSALVHELRRDLAAASASARAAQRLEPTNWRASYALARIETRRGRVREALDALRRARSLNRTSTAIR